MNIVPHYCIFAIVWMCFFISCSCGGRRQQHDQILDSNNDDNTITIIGKPDSEKTDSSSNTITIISEPDTCNTTLKKNDYSYEYLLTTKSNNTIPSQVLIRRGYITSYNHETRNPNWVGWRLTREHTSGPYSRKGVPYYAEDGTVYGIGRVTRETNKGVYFADMEAEEPRQSLTDWSTEYNMSHGHLCPAGDNKWDKAAMNQSFLLTNMCPQDYDLNGGGWKKLEEKCRKWAERFGELYIVAGPIFRGARHKKLGEILIPEAFFKVVLCMKGEPKAVGFIYENDSQSQSMYDNVCSVDEVEAVTGMDFFSALPDSIENEIEAKANLKEWR